MEIEVLKEIITIARHKSINKAAELLNMSQPNLSRDIKRLEEELGYKLFQRTNKGALLTKEGEEFLAYASDILKDVEAIKKITSRSYSQDFSIAVPKAFYIYDSFIAFAENLNNEEKMNIEYKETTSMGAIDEIVLNNFGLGIIRFPKETVDLVRDSLTNKNIEMEIISEFKYSVILSSNDPLAKKEHIVKEDLKDYIEISHGNSYFDLDHCDSEHTKSQKTIKMYESFGQMRMIKDIPHSFIVSYPIDVAVLKNAGLIKKEVEGISIDCYDAIISSRNYRKSFLDQKFIAILKYCLANGYIKK